MKTQVLWVCNTGESAVGIVKKFDEYQQCWYYYIGAGLPGAFSEELDIRHILAFGQRYSSLDFIARFQEREENQPKQ